MASAMRFRRSTLRCEQRATASDGAPRSPRRPGVAGWRRLVRGDGGRPDRRGNADEPDGGRPSSSGRQHGTADRHDRRARTAAQLPPGTPADQHPSRPAVRSGAARGRPCPARPGAPGRRAPHPRRCVRRVTAERSRAVHGAPVPGRPRRRRPAAALHRHPDAWRFQREQARDFTVRRTLGDDTTSRTQGDGLDIDEIVERVIDKIEQRVVDELERRGRYNSDGAF